MGTPRTRRLSVPRIPIVICVAMVFLASAAPAPAQSSNVLRLADAVGEFGSVAAIPLTLSTTDEVQGIIAAFEWDGAAGTGEDLISGPAIAAADTIVKRVEADYMVLGVVMDSDGVGDEILLPGDDLLLATAQIRCGSGPSERTTALRFRDSTYNTVDGAPLLDNLVVVAGLSITVAEGLVLSEGSLRCVEAPPKLFIQQPGGQNPGNDTTSASPRSGAASVRMQSSEPVEGYVVALCHDGSDLTLDAVTVGAAANAVGAEFSAADIDGAGGTLGVVLDFVPPFSGQTIAPGASQEIAVYRYTCRILPDRGSPPVPTPLSFCDNVLGSPLKENVIVVGGFGITRGDGLVLTDGIFECRPISGGGDPCDPNSGEDCPQSFRCTSAAASVGGTAVVTLQILNREDSASGHAQFDHIQGFSMAIRHCCGIELIDESLDISGTILEAIGAEFVSVQGDGAEAAVDGDGCEVIVGVLVDALPPFDGATIPPLPDFQTMGTLTFRVDDDAGLCDTVCSLEFVDGLDGTGKVPVKNLVSVENVSRPVTTIECEIPIVGRERFHRGDCNFSSMGGMSVDIADAAAIVSFLFLTGAWKFHPPCLDACDCNDDGRVDLADAICVLQYYLQAGEFPPLPGPGLAVTAQGGVVEIPPGVDPSDDKLDCAAGTFCDGP